MKQIVVICFALALLVATGCDKAEEVRAREESQQLERIQQNANEVVGNIQYIKDSRTGLCFAYCWVGMANGGPALATVPCDSVPPELLTVAK
ncbi:MAG: hypothetical protein ABIH48_00025 [Candidatus Falkowbacteria bacterium]